MTPRDKTDERYMRTALSQARRGLGRTSPNPSVGAVAVKEGSVLGKALHKRAGGDHAEAALLKAIGEKAKGATLYVTLEPCDHYGCTPPCSLAILNAGVRRVVVGCEDPNPAVSGRGIQRLREGGVKVDVGVLESRCRRLIETFTVAVTQRRAHVTIKAAVTLDGKLATRSGHSRWVSGPESLKLAHRLRNRLDTILVGGETVRLDNPSLTCRMVTGRDPIRIVLSNSLRLSPEAKVFHASSSRKRAPVIVATTRTAQESQAEKLRKVGAEIWRLPSNRGGVDLHVLLERLASSGKNSVLVEGGAAVHGAFLYEGLCDRAVYVVAPKILGGEDAVTAVQGPGPATMQGAVVLRDIETKRYGDDVMVTGVPDFSVSGVGEERARR